jgi:uroporphyrinogen-III synthase
VLKVKKILVSQPKPEGTKSPYFDIAEKYNVQVEFRPFIKVLPIDAREFFPQKINIKNYSSVVFTSRTGIDHFFRLTKEMKVKLSDEVKYFCLTDAFAYYIQKYTQYRKRKVFHPQSGKLHDFIKLIIEHGEESFLFVLPDGNNDEIINLLNNTDLKYGVAKMYRSVSNDFTANEAFDYDMILFFSPHGIGSLLKNFPNFEQGEICIGCLGTAAAQAIKDSGFRVDMEVPNPKFSSITLALDDFLKQNHKGRR